MKLEQIGFYTLLENRASNVSPTSPIMRAEILLTDRCNLKCPYCRGLDTYLRGDLSLPYVQQVLQDISAHKLVNVRFSGGEPTLYPHLKSLVLGCKKLGVKRIALSTNGTNDQKIYKELIACGVNDFSISLDSGCCAIGEKMTGGCKNSWNKAVDNIKFIASKCYTTIGVVFNEMNYQQAIDTIKFIDTLRPSDIRIIPSAQYGKALAVLKDLPKGISSKYPILQYRLNNLKAKRSFRGITKNDCHKCYLVLDDLALAGKYQFPCIIYLREMGMPISEMGEDFRNKRIEWFKKHNSFKDKICQKNCLDVCVDYNNRVDYYVRKNARHIV